MRLWVIFLAAIVPLLIVASAGGRGGATGATTANEARPEHITAKDFDPHAFPRAIDNPWFPLTPGTQLIFEGTTTEGKTKIPHRLVFTVTDLTKVVGGVRSIVLWDRDWSAGELVEAELAFFAQDSGGNVWQMGEYPEEYEEGKVVANPTWIHGIKGAKAGLTMRARPRLQTPSYSLGWGPAVGFNDRARVLAMGVKTCVPYRCFENVMVTDEYNPDEPRKHQLKYYARGVGNVRVGFSGAKEESKETLVLVKVVHLGPKAMAKVRAEALQLEKNAYKISKNVYGRTAPVEQWRLTAATP